MTFDEQIRQCCKERHKKEFFDSNRMQSRGEYIYTNFCVWCNAFKNGEGKDDYKLFEQYIKENNIVANWWQRKCIYENHFGFKFEYRNEKLVKVKV